MKHEKRPFSHGNYPQSRTAIPLLADAVANFECRFVTEYRPGNCPLVVGEVVASHVNADQSVKRLMNLSKGYQLGTIGDKK